MIDINKILKRAWHIVWNYKILWIFGILLVITTGGGGGNSGTGYQFSSDSRPGVPDSYQAGPMWEELEHWMDQEIWPLFNHPEEYLSTFIWVGVVILLVFLILGVLFTILRYVSETAILRMVNLYEQEGIKLRFREGWKLGWSRRAFRLWIIDLILSIPAVLVILVVLGIGVIIAVTLIRGEPWTSVVGTVTAIGFTFIFIFTLILISVFLNLLRQFFIRSAALDETLLGDSFRKGWRLFKNQWKNAALMWLVMLGISIGFSIASIFMFFLFIPIYAILLIPGVLVAAIPGLIAFGISSLFAGIVLSAILGVVVALPFLFTVLFAPLYLIGSFYKVFESSVWTLTYQEMKVLDALLPNTANETATKTA